MRTVLNATGIFGLAVTALLLLKSTAQKRTTPASAHDLRGSVWLLAALALTTACFWKALYCPFLSDEFVLIKHARNFRPAHLWHLLTHAGGDGHFRPLGFVLAALLLCLSYTAHRRIWMLLASFACLMLALLSKESAYVFPLLLVLVILSSENFSWRRAAGILMWAFTVTGLTFAYRWHLMGGIGGYRDPVTGIPQALQITLVGLLKVLVLRIWAVLYFPVNWSVQPPYYLLLSLAVTIAGLIYLAARPVHRADLILPLGFILISVLPVLHLLLIGPDLLGAPRLYLASIGFAILMAVALQSIAPRRLRTTVAVVLLLFQVSALHHNLSIWRDTGLVAKRTCETLGRATVTSPSVAVVQNLPSVLHGVYFFRNGLAECVQFYSFTRIKRSDGIENGEVFVWDPATLSLRKQR